jgi:hypothetical protein
MERLEPEIPKPKSHSKESIALQEAESGLGTFVVFRRFFADGDSLERDAAGLVSDFEVVGLDGDNYSVGRHPDSDLVLDWDPTVSRSHARLSRAGASWYLEDLNSENGTVVNGNRVSRVRLGDNDQIRIGDTVIVFRQPGSSKVRETVTAGEPLPALTDPQRQVLVALAEPLFGAEPLRDPSTNTEISERVHLSLDSVKGHLRHLYKVFGIGPEVPQNRKRRKLADEAIRRGAVTSRDYP